MKARVGVVGAGWAGLAAAWRLAQQGHAVVLWEMAPQAGGRGRSGVAPPPGCPVDLDAGQHILIGAYTATLGLMKELGVDAEAMMHRRPLELVDAQGRGLRLPPGPPALAFLRGLWSHPEWTLHDKLTTLRELVRWRWLGFSCPETMTVAQWCRLTPRVMTDWVEPLCVAALNTEAQRASAQVFLRVLADGLFAGPGGSDLLIPRQPLRALLPDPVLARLKAMADPARPTDHQGSVPAPRFDLRLHRRVARLEPGPRPGSWRVDDETVDGLIVATSPLEAARLIEPWDAAWAESARALQHEPIVTTWVAWPGARLNAPMVSLPPGSGPAQFAFDLGRLGHPWRDGFSFVSSTAGSWLEQGLPALEAAVMKQARQTLQPPADAAAAPARIWRSVAEKRATFRCEAGLRRPQPRAADAHGGLQIAGDYVAGPYPATLEGAIRAGEAAAAAITNSSSRNPFHDAKSAHGG